MYQFGWNWCNEDRSKFSKLDSRVYCQIYWSIINYFLVMKLLQSEYNFKNLFKSSLKFKIDRHFFLAISRVTPYFFAFMNHGLETVSHHLHTCYTEVCLFEPHQILQNIWDHLG